MWLRETAFTGSCAGCCDSDFDGGGNEEARNGKGSLEHCRLQLGTYVGLPMHGIQDRNDLSNATSACIRQG